MSQGSPQASSPGTSADTSSATAAAKLFGTDGIRGVANTELTPELAFKLGRALLAVLPDAAFTAPAG
ncbi:MAG: hypothetical protein FWF11_00725, partial [Coriobacteriia bacterium]|nr:hypothetical protein [Coriobacteriia bacterium]